MSNDKTTNKTRDKQVPFTSLKLGERFHYRGAEFVKINEDEAVKTEHDGYHYANFGAVLVVKNINRRNKDA